MIHARAPRSRFPSTMAVVCALLIGVLAVPVVAAPMFASPERTAGDEPYVTLDMGSVSTATDGSFSFRSNIRVDQPTSYLEARLQIRSPNGRLIYQKTEVRNNVETATVTIAYSRDLEDLDLRPGAYPVTLRVRSDSGAVREWNVEGELLLYDPAAAAVPLALVVRVMATPLTDPEGRFVVDPVRADQARDQVEQLALAVLEQPSFRGSLAIAPVILEEWSQIADGYETVGPEGVATVAPGTDTPELYAGTLTLLAQALSTDRLELLDVPYAAPDMAGLVETDRMPDLLEHFSRGLSAYLASIETSPSSGAATAASALPSSALDILSARKITHALVSPQSIESTETTPSSQAYRVDDADPALMALVVDDDASSALRSAEPGAFARQVFQRTLSDDRDAALIAVTEVGPGVPASVESLSECLDSLLDAPWVDFATAGEVAEAARATSPPVLRLAEQVADSVPAPTGYWQSVAEARLWSSSYLASVGVNDPEAQAANGSSLVAQSRAWAGPDDSWALADRGRSYAAAALRDSQDVLGAVEVSASDLTLSGSRGEVPVVVTNGSEKNLLLTITYSGDGVALPEGSGASVTVRPQENFFTVPVDLQSSLAGSLDVQVRAGDIVLDEITVRVSSSYLDRLAIVGGVAIVLLGMLLFIRHRVLRANADTMESREEA